MHCKFPAKPRANWLGTFSASYTRSINESRSGISQKILAAKYCNITFSFQPVMAPSAQSHSRNHSLLLLQKLLNLRDSASPLTLLLDTIEQSAAPLLREFMGRAKVCPVISVMLFLVCLVYGGPILLVVLMSNISVSILSLRTW